MSQRTKIRDSRTRFIIASTALVGFIYQFESNLVNVALPTISSELGMSMARAALVPVSFYISATAALVPAGRLGWRHGLKRVFLASIALMALGTTICGLSPNEGLLLGGRVLQGLGGGGMGALGFAIISTMLPPNVVGLGFGRYSMAAGLGMLAGNPVGGFLAQFLPWRLVFLTNVPFMLGLLFFAWRVLPQDTPDPEARTTPLGLLDSLLLSLCVSCGVLGLSFGNRLGYASPAILGILATFAGLAGLLLWRGRAGRLVFLPPAMLRNKAFLHGLASIFLFGMALSGMIFLTPFYLEIACQLTPARSSGLMLFFAGAYALSAPFAGPLADRCKPRTLLLAAGLLGALACGVFAAVSTLGMWQLALVFLVALATAGGVTSPSANKNAMAALPDGLKAQAAAFPPMAVICGSAVGISIIESIYSMELTLQATATTTTAAAATGGASRGFLLAFATAGCFWLGMAGLNIRGGLASRACQHKRGDAPR